MPRAAIPKKTRFDVFKRDSFKCQYCGASAPEAVLHADHIHPVSQGGTNDLMNLVTACSGCNLGKSDKLLSDQSAVQKQKTQLDELNARREQLEMMLQWRNAIADIAADELGVITEAWSEAATGWHLNDTGEAEAKKHLKKYGLSAVLDAIDVARSNYIKFSTEGKATAETVNAAWKKVGGILRVSSMPDDERQLHYVKGILRKRLNWMPYDAIREIKGAYQSGVSIEDMTLEAKHATSWNKFHNWLIDTAGC